jgi:hypothetical protein
LLAARLDERGTIISTGDVFQGTFYDKRGDRDGRTIACRVTTTIVILCGMNRVVLHRYTNREKSEIGHESGSFPLAP